MADDYAQIQTRMKEGRFGPDDLAGMNQIMQYANLPAKWRKVQEAKKEEVSETRRKVSGFFSKPIEVEDEAVSPSIAPKKDINREINEKVDEAAAGLGVDRGTYEKFLMITGIGGHSEEKPDKTGTRQFKLHPGTRIPDLEKAITWVNKQGFKIDSGGSIHVKALDLSDLPGEAQLPEHLYVDSDLDLTNQRITTIPKALTVNGSLILTNAHVEDIEPLLTVNGDLELVNCRELQMIGRGATVKGNLICSGCTALSVFPDRRHLAVGGNIIGDDIALFIAQNLGFYIPKKTLFGGKSDREIDKHKYIHYKPVSERQDITTEKKPNTSSLKKGYLTVPKEMRGGGRDKNIII
ncbi:MAG: hypothetical protein V1880_01135 [Patescibacteria group bacterium]